MILLLALYLIAVNAAAVAAFGIDKGKAIAGRRRISEARLLHLATLGGTPGAFRGRRHFRHKTRKQPFSRRLETIAMVQAGIVGGLGFFWIVG